MLTFSVSSGLHLVDGNIYHVILYLVFIDKMVFIDKVTESD